MPGRIHERPALVPSDPRVVAEVRGVRRGEIPRHERHRHVIRLDRIRQTVRAFGGEGSHNETATLFPREGGKSSLVLFTRFPVERRKLRFPARCGRLARLAELRAAVGVDQFDALAIRGGPLGESPAHARESVVSQFGREHDLGDPTNHRAIERRVLLGGDCSNPRLDFSCADAKAECGTDAAEPTDKGAAGEHAANVRGGGRATRSNEMWHVSLAMNFGAQFRTGFRATAARLISVLKSHVSHPVLLSFAGGSVRSWETSDAPSLARSANNRAIWRNLKDRFPNPYTLANAEGFIAHCRTEDPESAFAIVVDGEAIGAIGFEHRGDIWRRSVELGYWIAEPYWGRGITTGAVRAVTDWAFETWELNRVWAGVFAWNPASARVLEKAGYSFEARLKQSAVKDGEPVDELIYAVVR